MASFVASLFSNSKAQDKQDAAQRPCTPNPNRNSFVNPSTTPQGSPSKKTVPPGAHDLPVAFDNLKLTNSPLEAPVKFDPSALSTHLTPGKINNNAINIFEDSPAIVADESIIQKPAATASPRKHGQENTPPVSSRPPIVDSPSYISHAAVARQGLFQQPGRERPASPAKKFNTSRGLTAEERELLQKPSVKRLVNVTQLCTVSLLSASPIQTNMVQTSSITTSTCSPMSGSGKPASTPSKPRIRPQRRRKSRRNTTRCTGSTAAASAPTCASAA